VKEPASPQRSVAARRGRGALSNREGRYERTRVDWDAPDLEPDPDHDDAAPPPLPTTVTPETTRSIIATNDSPDVGFDQSINPYRGCEHGCVYCFARPTHAWLGLSPGLDFETRLFSKPDAAPLLRQALSRRGYVCRTIALGANTDAYQPVERDLRLTRGILEVLAEYRHPVIVITKSDLVLRDLDLLSPMAAKKLAAVMVSITTLDRRLARRMEPRAAIPGKRLEAVRRLTEAGVPTGVLTAPIIPGLNDSELEAILEASAEAGAVSAGYVLLRLPLEIKDLFREWLETHYALKADRVLALLKEMRGGRLYDPRFGKRMSGEGPHAALLQKRFTVALRRLGLRHRALPLDETLFRVPQQPGDQGRLFDR
jgi:DNA repair photolyase